MNTINMKEQIVFLRKQKGLTQEELAKALGVTEYLTVVRIIFEHGMLFGSGCAENYVCNTGIDDWGF